MCETVQQGVEGQQPTGDTGTKETPTVEAIASGPGRSLPPHVEAAGGSGSDRDPLERIIEALRCGEKCAALLWRTSEGVRKDVADVLQDVLEAIRESLEDSE